MFNYLNKDEMKQLLRRKLKENGIEIDVAFTSLLTRALETTQFY